MFSLIMRHTIVRLSLAAILSIAILILQGCQDTSDNLAAFLGPNDENSTTPQSQVESPTTITTTELATTSSVNKTPGSDQFIDSDDGFEYNGNYTSYLAVGSELAPQCWGRLGSILEDFGRGVGYLRSYNSLAECESACTRNTECKHFITCSELGNQCYLRDKDVTPGAPLLAPYGGCATYYPKDCVGWEQLNGAVADEGNGVGAEIQYQSISECKAACEGNPSCKSFTACSEYMKCWLKDKQITADMALADPSGGCRTHYITTTETTTTAPCWKSLDRLIEAEGEGVGGEITYTTVSECMDECDANAACNSFTACPGYGRKCYLKAKMVTPGEAFQADRGECATYAKGACEETTTTTTTVAMCWDNLDGIAAIEGSEIGSLRYQTVADCQKACDRDASCNSFSACPGYGNQCWLKNKRITPGEGLQAPHGGCKSHYRRVAPCGSTAGTPAPTKAPTPPPTPAPPVTACTGPTAANVCDVPAGQCATLSGTQYCAVANVKGTLTLQTGAKLTTPKLHVHRGGTLMVGTAANPAGTLQNPVEIDLQGGELFSEGNTYIYGKPKTSWTTLSAPCNSCTTIQVASCDGWEVGDNIVLVGTGNGEDGKAMGQVQANERYGTDERKIAAITGCSITLDTPASQNHRSEMYKGKVKITSEVLNMERSVKIFGTSATTRQHETGIMQVHHARLWGCGKLVEGEYCLHFHHLGDCPQCSFVGNAIGWPSVNKGITIHGTSRTKVEENIVYKHKGAYMYIEDGNEVGNSIKNNALVCEKVAGCKLKNGPRKHRSSDDLEQAGLYVVSATNDFIGNHISGMENAFFQDFQGGAKIFGDSRSHKKTCPTANPFGTVSDNYFHNNAGFGFYSPHSSYPTRVSVDKDGMVTDWNSCLGFNPTTGEDNSAAYTVLRHTELWHNFGAGGYDGGETSFKDSVFAFGIATNYYKTFRRGIRSGPICENCFYTDNLFPNTPGGACMWEYKNTIFENTLVGLHVNHHCGNDGEWTGGICASHVMFTGTSEWKDAPFKINNDGFPKCKQYSDTIVHYNGNTYIGTGFSHPAFDLNRQGCQSGQAGGAWTSCPGNDIRIVRIYSAYRGDLRVTNNNHGYTRTVPYTPWNKGATWGRPNLYDISTKYQNGGMGYSFLVIKGHSYTLQVGEGSEPDFFTLEYSDAQMPEDSITLQVAGSGRIAGGPCEIKSTHNRNWISPYGPYIPQSGAWWHCKRWAVTYTQQQHQEAQRRHFQNHGIQV